MALKTSKLAAATALAAAFSMLATPAQARDYYRYGHRDRVDVGDVLTGVLILGGIAAVAGAVNNGSRNTRYPDRYPDPYRGDAARYRKPGAYNQNQGRGIDRAVDQCVAEVERRSGPVDSVESANRGPNGWSVSGTLRNGQGYSCSIGNDGRVSDVDVGNGQYNQGYAQPDGDDDQAYGDKADSQWDDQAYARARVKQNGPPPLPSGDGYNDGYAGDDGRYATADTPDFNP